VTDIFAYVGEVVTHKDRFTQGLLHRDNVTAAGKEKDDAGIVTGYRIAIIRAMIKNGKTGIIFPLHN
jgi:hypothetical protein